MSARLELKGMRLEPFNYPINKEEGRRVRHHYYIDQIKTSPSLAIMTGTSNIHLTRKISRILNQDFGIAAGRYDEGEVGIQLPTVVDGRDVFIVQSTNPSADNLQELYLMVDACRRASAQKINVVIPYFGYSRKDRKDRPRAPISAAQVARFLEAAGVDTISTVDIHAEQELGFTDRPWNNVHAVTILKEVLSRLDLKNPCYVTTDIGGDKNIRQFALSAGANPDSDTATVIKERSNGKTAPKYVQGNVKGRDVVFVDDIINSGGSLMGAAKLAEQQSAREIYAIIIHGLMFDKKGKVNPKVLENLLSSPVKKLFLTDTVRQPPEVTQHPKIEIISVAPLLAELIKRIHEGQPLSPDLID